MERAELRVAVGEVEFDEEEPDRTHLDVPLPAAPVTPARQTEFQLLSPTGHHSFGWPRTM